MRKRSGLTLLHRVCRAVRPVSVEKGILVVEEAHSCGSDVSNTQLWPTLHLDGRLDEKRALCPVNRLGMTIRACTSGFCSGEEAGRRVRGHLVGCVKRTISGVTTKPGTPVLDYQAGYCRVPFEGPGRPGGAAG